MTGCSSTTQVCPIPLQDNLKSDYKIEKPDSWLMEEPSTPKMLDKQNNSKKEVLNTIRKNNTLWEKDRLKLKGLQNYVSLILENEYEVSKR